MFSLKVILILTFIASGPLFAVDRGNFKTCKQSSFCDRQRQIPENSLKYYLDPDSLTVGQSGVRGSIYSANSNINLTLKVEYLPHSIFHVLIDEVTTEYKRFRVPDGLVILENVTPTTVRAVKDDLKVTLVGHFADKAVISYNPFRIDFLMDDKLVTSLNHRSLMHFENQRIKPPMPTEDAIVEKKDDMTGDGNTVADSKNERPTRVSEDASAVQEPELHKADSEPSESNNEDLKLDEDTANSSADTAVENVKADPSWAEHFKEHLDSRPNGLNSLAADIDFHGISHVYGIPEHADNTLLRSTTSGEPYRLYNLDVFEYELDNVMALYGSVPLMWGHNSNYTVGVLWLNPSETWVDVEYGNSQKSGILSRLPNLFSKKVDDNFVKTRWMSESGILDSYFILSRSPPEASKAYAYLTGTTKLPPLFSLAYHQSRWNYNDETDVLTVDKNFDDNQIPMDTIWLDIEHCNGKRYFTWDSHKFPNPGDMVDKLNAKGRKLVTVVDPHIKRDSNWALYQDAQKRGLFVKARDGSEYDGWCWPGSSSWPDFIDPDVRRWWAEQFLTYDPVRTTTMFSWNDMGEPSVFNGPEVTMHKDALHFGGWEHRDIHNLFGLYIHQSTWEGQLLRSKGAERPFVLTRAFFAGSQRTSAVWTGDNTADWGHLKASVSMVLSLSIAGITFSGADVGGFFGNPDPELSVRWFQAAAYQPFFRVHSHMDTKRREPWLLPVENVNIVRLAINSRYNFLPYWYTMFARSEADGQPVMAPMWFHFPKDINTFTLDNQYMVGEALLVRPVTEQGARSVDIYFPKGTWYHFPSFERFVGDQTVQYPVTLSSIPVFCRGGWIVPRKERIRRSSWLMRYDPYTFYVFLDSALSEAIGYIYYDDFHSTSVENAHFYKIIYKSIPDPTGRRGGQLSLESLPIPTTSGSSHSIPSSDKFPIPKIERVVLIGLTHPIKRVTVIEQAGQRRNVEFTQSTSDFSQPNQVLVVRKPNLKVDGTWQLHFVTGLESKDDL